MTNETKEVAEGVDQLDLSNAIYSSEKHGSDETGDGTAEKPYKTTAFALKKSGKIDTFSAIYVDAKDEATGKYELISKSQLKKIRNYCEGEAKKEAQKHTRELEDAQRREKNLEEAKKVVIKEDPSLPKANILKIKETNADVKGRVRIYGWVHRLRRQGKTLMFLVLRDGTGFLQCVLNNELCQTYDAVLLSTEATVGVYGTLQSVPEGKKSTKKH